MSFSPTWRPGGSAPAGPFIAPRAILGGINSYVLDVRHARNLIFIASRMVAGPMAYFEKVTAYLNFSEN
jgi:hypothetical protein